METQRKGKVAIIGSGLIGSSWAMLFAGAGYTVQLYDVLPDRLKTVIAEIEMQLENLAKQNLLRSSIPVREQLAAISTTSDLATCMNGAFYVQECVFESPEAKKAIFAQMDKLVSNEAQILASSVSTIMPSIFTENLKNREKCVVAHPVNPPFYVPLVELVPSQWTKPEVVDRTYALMKELGQVPVRLKKEIAGFALNRLQYALLAECWRLVKEDVLSVDDLDKVMSDGLGPRYAFVGPLEICHLNAEGMREYAEKYNRGYLNVCSTMGPAPSWDGEVLEKISAQLEAKVPVEKLQERRKWRDQRLAGLAKLKKETN